MERLWKLTKRRMNRKEFLVYCGYFILTLTGISGIIKNLSDLDLSDISKKKNPQSFGFGPYGGIKKEIK